MSIVVTGSLAFDYIMDFPGYFIDHILPEKAHQLSVSFLVESMRSREPGGVGGNVAYTLALLGERPRLFASVGRDFGEYGRRLEQIGVDTSTVNIVEHEYTATCFVNTDRSGNQIVAFYPGAMAFDRQLALHMIGTRPDDWVVIAATDPMAMQARVSECQELGVNYILEPGKQSPNMSVDYLTSAMQSAQVMIGNDYEFGLMSKKLGISETSLIMSTPITVVTRGELGSIIYSKAHPGKEIHIPSAAPTAMTDPTGAGDAYLAGFAFGMVRSLPLEMTGRIAALCATYAIEHRGCQAHAYTLADFATRYEAVFGTAPELAEALAL